MAAKDKAFRRLLGDKEIFLKFLRRFLRQDLPYQVDPQELTLEDVALENVSFIPPSLSESISDVLYKIRSETREVYVYILVEHQSKTDFLMPYRLLSYMMQIWSRCVEAAGEGSKRKSFLLPPILPVVFYEGPRRWTAPRNFTDKVASSEEFRGYIPDFGYRLIALREKTSEELLAFRDALGGLLYLAHPSKEEHLLETMEKIRLFLKELPLEESRLLGKHFLGYWKILTAGTGEFGEDFLLEEHFEEEGEDMITYLEKEIRLIRREGREEGREEGWQQGRQEQSMTFALAMLKAGEPEEKILAYTGLSPEELKKLRLRMDADFTKPEE